MPSVDPRVQRSRAAVLDAAVDLFVEGGVGAVTVDAVVVRSGVAKTTIYRHWGSQRELLLDVFRRFDHRFERPPDDWSPSERLRDLLRQFESLVAATEWRRALPVLLDVTRRVDEFADLHEPFGSPGAISDAIADCVAAGVLPPDLIVGEVLLQLMGPLTLAAILDPHLLGHGFADRLVDGMVGPRGGA